MLRIAITDDHTLFRKSLGLLINSFKNMEVVVEASNGIQLLKKLETNQVDVLLLDLQMPEMDGFETCQKIKELYPNIKTLVLTLMNETDTIKRVVKMGVQGYFTKNTPPKELEDAIWKLEENGFYFEKSLASVINEILDNLETNIEDKEIQFTERELEIITLTAQGLKSKDVADTLHISTKTVNTHKQNIQNKYNFDNMMTAILYCVKQKIIKI
ncbi:response regulator transcription factor [Chryseobacterium taichungense]|nr:response regulator transcription factor [Chryseobacterium taichungense]